MTVTLEIPAEIEATLQVQAPALGLTIQQWLLQLAEQAVDLEAMMEECASGMVEENGLLVPDRTSAADPRVH